MKQLACIAVAAVFLGAFQVAYGNMAAPAEPDVGTAITLEQNETLAVKSEVLDIVIEDLPHRSQLPIRWKTSLMKR